MTFRYWYELSAGIILLFSVLLFGETGIAAIAILAFLPIIMRLKSIKPDEREMQLFYKGVQIIFSSLIFLIVLFFLFTGFDFSDLQNVERKSWYLLLAGILIFHGSVQLFLLFKR